MSLKKQQKLAAHLEKPMENESKVPSRYENDPSTLDSGLGYKPVPQGAGDRFTAKFTVGAKELHIGPFGTFKELVQAGKEHNVTCVVEPYFGKAGEVREDTTNNVVVGTWNKL